VNIDWSECPAVERRPDRINGAWMFAGTHVPLVLLFENLDAGASIKDFVEWFDGVTFDQVHQVLTYVTRSSDRFAVA